MKPGAHAFVPHKCGQKLGSPLPTLQCGQGLCDCFCSWGIVAPRLQSKVHIPDPPLLAENFPPCFLSLPIIH